MKKKNLIGTYLALLTMCLCLLSSCGKDEVYQPETTIDNYVYAAQKIQAMDNLIGVKLAGDLITEGDYLYYARLGEKGTEICRIPLSSISPDNDAQVLPKSEAVLTFKPAPTAVPDYIADQLPTRLLGGNSDSEQSMWILSDDGDMIEISQLYCSFAFTNFDVDKEGNIYCLQEVLVGKNFDLESIGGTLSKWSREGENVYQVYFPDIQAFTLFGDEGACILGEGRILLIDGDGLKKGECSTEQYRGNKNPVSEHLFRTEEGHVYYTLFNYNRNTWGFEVLNDEGLELKEMKGNFYQAVGSGIYTSSEGKMFPVSGYGNFLYEYDAENDSVKEVLNWTNSGFLGQYVRSLVQITPEELLIYYNDYSSAQGIYLLSRTAGDGLPEKETIIIFSYDPTEILRKAVMQFNKDNDDYQIIIDSYGAEFSWRTMEGDAPLVDLAVVSQTPPDMLDMTFLDPHKYAAKGVLEDLYPYLEKSSILNKEDFLENALEGMTLDGCLTCIPQFFSIDPIQGRKSHVGQLKSWDMEAVYELWNASPESAPWVISDVYDGTENRGYLLNTFCSYYILEKFVDWENREVYFDSPEFSKLLKWVGEYVETTSSEENLYINCITEDVLLFHNKWTDFLEMPRNDIRCRDEAVPLGFPSADGEGIYPVSIWDALAITANSSHKDVAWEFIEYFLSTYEPGYFGYSPKKEWLLRKEKNAVSGLSNSSGDLIVITYADAGGEKIPIYTCSQEQADLQMAILESADFTPRSEKEKMILRVISEEAESYYNGDKSIEEVIQIIQNRAGLILQE